MMYRETEEECNRDYEQLVLITVKPKIIWIKIIGHIDINLCMHIFYIVMSNKWT
jgi:hypothetical protein